MAEKKNSKGREVFLKNRQIHFDFREVYNDHQMKVISICSIICGIYSIIGYAFIGTYLANNDSLAKTQYALLGLSSLIVIISTLIARSKVVFKSEYARFQFGEIISIMDAIVYIMWGFSALIFSIKDGRESNYLLVLMVYAVCSIFMYYSLQHYVALYLLCIIGAFVTMNIFKDGEYDASLMVNVIIFGFLLTLGGIIKYYSSEYRFLAEREANILRQNLEANNEELTATNEDLIQTTEKLKNYIESQRLFTASMNHELRSPLNGIIGLLQILKTNKDLPESAIEEIDNAYASSETLIQIVNDLLDYAKLEAGEFTIIKDRFDVRQVVSNIESMQIGSAAAKGIDLIFDIDASMPCILYGDGMRIQQIAVNLISNGIKYTERGFVKLRMYVDDSHLLNIVVTDSGQGISKDVQEMLFRPFVRVNENRNKYIQGTGLGLTIVRNLAQQMDGMVSVDSQLGKGSTFTAKIPVEIIDNGIRYGEAKVTVKETGKTEELPDFGGKKLLCVDDNAVNLVVFKGLYNGTNAIIRTMIDGKSALEEITKVKYDLIFLDHMMPGMDGIEVFEKMNEMDKSINLNADTPVIMLTANAGQEAERNYIGLGFAGYLPKPVLRDELFAVTERMLK